MSSLPVVNHAPTTERKDSTANWIVDSKPQDDHVEDIKNVAVDNINDSEAAPYVDHTIIIDEAENKRLKRMIDRRILPLLCLAYFAQAMDKGATSPISIMGWLEDVGAKDQDYALSSTVLWIGLVAGNPVASQLIRRFPVAKVLAASMLVWTGLAFALVFSLSVPPILANRAILGLFEASFNPCLVTIMVQWYLSSEQALISAVWHSFTSLSTCLQSVMGYGFYHVRHNAAGGLKSWQYLLLTAACISAVATITVFLLLPDSPTRARWANEELKTKFVERVRSNNQGIKQKVWKSEQAWETAKDPQVYALFALTFCQTLVIGGVGKFASLLINRAFGFDVATSQLLKIPVSVVGVCAYFLMAYLQQKTEQTFFVMIGFTLLNMVGTIVIVCVPPGNKTRVGLMIAFLCMQFFGACNTATSVVLSRNIAGQTKKSIAYATTFMAWGAGNAVSPQLFWNTWAPRYINTLYIHLGLYATYILLALATRTMLIRRNAKKQAARELRGEDELHANLHAFEDLTDIQNPDYKYSI
ncbi:hypothetical protein I316_01578 [Kwoniella heveanensis BCC8398]|uniref:Major facilitator superfamily (MFS) profile domain-containing protein n=1 Tax=Kwoniella heveanensis BCC8398 TaxID=1296120 RepID=A0A1B9H152_9TREE|nr:hypothetical protein I316_01578 [Kwoniella heveanensis BCC8398]